MESRDFFISYTGADREWAEWIAATLEDAGFTTIVQAWDFRPGDDFVHRMQGAIEAARRTVVVLSPDYLRSAFGASEWHAVFAKDPLGEKGLLVPVRVKPCDPSGLLASRVYIDLVGADPRAAAERLRSGVAAGRLRPAGVRFPGPSTGGGWQLAADPEGARHWLPRSRGVSRQLEPGFRFRGRTQALREIVAWLDRPAPDRQVLAITGSPGVGKSAVLGRIVATADEDYRAGLPASDTAVRATAGSVACAVHAKGRTAVEVAQEIARAAGALPPAQAEDLALEVHTSLAGRGRRFTVVIDAIDEAATPQDARTILTEVVQPLAQGCGDVGVRVVVGLRRNDHEGRLLDLLAGVARVIDLDLPEYFALADLRDYALATLRLLGDERPGNPYADEAVAGPVAHRIAELAGQNFLVAGLEARMRGMYDTAAADPATLTFTGTVDATLDIYLRKVPPVGGFPARLLLTVLARAEAPGWTTGLWRLALGAEIHEGLLADFARSAAANFLIESADGSFRLFHQALTDALLRGRGPADERQITHAFLAHGRRHGWAGYLARSLSAHAARAGLIDELLAADDYLWHADLLRLIPLAEGARTETGRDRARMLRLTPQAVEAAPPERAALFSTTAALEGFSAPAPSVPAPYRARWAVTLRRGERAVFPGHEHTVVVACTVVVGERSFLATADRETVLIRDPANGSLHGRLTGLSFLKSMCSVPGDEHDLLATGDRLGRIRFWDPVTCRELVGFAAHRGDVNALVPVQVGDRRLLASLGDDGLVRLWQAGTGARVGRLADRRVRSLCAVVVGGITLLAAGRSDGSVQLWDPDTMVCQRYLADQSTYAVTALCAYRHDGRNLLASGGSDGRIQLWDLDTGRKWYRIFLEQSNIAHIMPLEADGVSALLILGGDSRLWRWELPGEAAQESFAAQSIEFARVARLAGRPLVITSTYDRAVYLWDAAALWRHPAPSLQIRDAEMIGEFVTAQGRWVAAVGRDNVVVLWDAVTGREERRLPRCPSRVRSGCVVQVSGRPMLALGTAHGSLRLWDPVAGAEVHQLPQDAGALLAMCVVPMEGKEMIAAGYENGTVTVWDPETGAEQRYFDGHARPIEALCVLPTDQGNRLVSGDSDGEVVVWDLATGVELTRITQHRGEVWSLVAVSLRGRTLLASAGNRETVALWEPMTGKLVRRLEADFGSVGALASLTVDSRGLLAVAGYDSKSVLLWDPETGETALTIPVHHGARTLARLRTGLAVGLEAGLLVLDLAGMDEAGMDQAGMDQDW